MLSCIFRYTPGLDGVSSGWVIIVCAVIASALVALRYPVDEEEEKQKEYDRELPEEEAGR